MAIDIIVGNLSFPVGTPAFLNSFFSTVTVRLENGSRGSRFHLMNQIYAGELAAKDATAALDELRRVQDELARFAPDQIVWDEEDQTRQPPWGATIAPSITSLANYFWTSAGKPLPEVIAAALTEAIATGFPLTIR